VLRKARFWEAHAADGLSERQRLVVDRLLNGFEGKMTSSKYAILARCSQDTAARDIDDLSSKGIFARDPAGGRSTSYSLIVSVGDAPNAMARWILEHADKSVWDGSNLPSLEDRRVREERIRTVGRDLRELAQNSDARPTQGDVEARLRALQELGFSPDRRLVSAVARAFHQASD